MCDESHYLIILICPKDYQDNHLNFGRPTKCTLTIGPCNKKPRSPLLTTILFLFFSKSPKAILEKNFPPNINSWVEDESIVTRL